MEEVLGAHTDSDRFDSFLEHWETVLARRVDEAVAAFTQIPGVCGLIVAGSVGRSEAWPLSDIDLLPIYEDDSAEEVRDEVERRRIEPLERWVHEGWWTGIDIGNLVFDRDEVMQAFHAGEEGVMARLRDNHWYHSVDKGYRGRAVYDPTGFAARLAQWFTDHRFRPEVVRLRLKRGRGEVEQALRRLEECRSNQDALGATTALFAAVHWLRIWFMEGWGERDNSLARFGTRFERVAIARGRRDLIDAVNALTDLDEETAAKRLTAAPWWVGERHERQWRARQQIREDVTRAEDIRDVLRVSVHYAIREVTGAPFPSWLPVPVDLDVLDTKIARLSTLVRQSFDD